MKPFAPTRFAARLRSIAKTHDLDLIGAGSLLEVIVLARVLPRDYTSPQMLYPGHVVNRATDLVACLLVVTAGPALTGLNRAPRQVTSRSAGFVQLGLGLVVFVESSIWIVAFWAAKGGANGEVLLAALRSLIGYLTIALAACRLGGVVIGLSCPVGFFLISSMFAYGPEGRISVWAWNYRPGTDLGSWLVVLGLALLGLGIVFLDSPARRMLKRSGRTRTFAP